MEVIKSNLQESLNVNNKRESYVKPPVPPKPKFIPKPKYVNNLKNVSLTQKSLKISTDENISQEIKETSKICDRLSMASDSSGSTRDSKDIDGYSDEISIKDTSSIEITPDSNQNDTPPSESPDTSPVKICSDYMDNSLSYSSSGEYDTKSENMSESQRPDGTEDISSKIMETALEDCARLSSKSSSNSSISYGDSDSDELTPPKGLDLIAENLAIPPGNSPINYDTSSSDNSISSVGFDRQNNEKDVNAIRNKKAFLVAKEIKTSEESFVATLKLLNVNFRQFLLDKGCVNTSFKASEKNKSDLIPESHLDEIFKFLPNLQNLNEEILADFKSRIKSWNETPKIADIIVKKGPFLKIYAHYIKELEAHTSFLTECTSRYTSFGECVQEFENSDMGRHIPISKHMLTPMQRVTKYKELMKQYLKYLDKDHIDYADAVEALDIVQGVAEHANEAIRELENSARLLCLQERLNGISNADGVLTGGSSSGNLQHLLVEPGRRLLKEGQLLKLCRRGIRVVYLILLSDTLLYTTEELHGGKNCPLKLRYKLPLEGMRVDIPVSEDFQSEFTVISTSRSFTVRARSTRERDEWLLCLRRAIESNANRRYSFEKAKTADFEYLSSNALGKQAPAWIPDNRVTMCQLCTSEFSLTFRRHHCRACGKVVCRYCSANRAPLEYLDYHTERVCDICFEELQKAMSRLEKKEDEIDDEGERENLKKRLKMIRGRFKKGIRGDRRIKSKKPERLLEVCGGDHSSQICGYLRHFHKRAWHQSWFVLKDKVLYEYRAPEDVCALTSLPILGYKVNSEFKSLDIFDGMDPSNAFQLVHDNQPPLIYYSESNDLASRWRTVMEKEVDL